MSSEKSGRLRPKRSWPPCLSKWPPTAGANMAVTVERTDGAPSSSVVSPPPRDAWGSSDAPGGAISEMRLMRRLTFSSTFSSRRATARFAISDRSILCASFSSAATRPQSTSMTSVSAFSSSASMW